MAGRPRLAPAGHGPGASKRLAGENRTTLFPLQLLFSGPLVVPVLWAGRGRCAGAGWARRYRALLWTWLAGSALCFVTAGRPYYVLPLTTVVLITGFVAWVREGRTRVLPWLLVPSAACHRRAGAPGPAGGLGEGDGAVNEAVAETVGWPQLVDQVAGVVHDLPPAEQAHVVLLTGYLRRGRRHRPLRPEPRAPARVLGPQQLRRLPADRPTPTPPWSPSATTVATLEQWFARCKQVATVDNGLDIDNEVQGQPIVVCRGLRTTWPETWAQLRFLS